VATSVAGDLSAFQILVASTRIDRTDQGGTGTRTPKGTELGRPRVRVDLKRARAMLTQRGLRPTALALGCSVNTLRKALAGEARGWHSCPFETAGLHFWLLIAGQAPKVTLELLCDTRLHMRSSNRHVLMVTCFVFLLGSLCSPGRFP